jgi:hypothetical protein
MDSGRREKCTDHEVEAALQALDPRARRVPAAAWPADLADPLIDQPGLYSWWVDEDGAMDLARGIGAAVAAGRVYAGQTGATSWPSGKVPTSTLKSRIGRNHLRGTIRGSTFRLTLAAGLGQALGLKPAGPRRLEPTSEETLSKWMRKHLEVVVHPFEYRDPLGDLEERLLRALDPLLNLDGRPETQIRISLRTLRHALAQDVPTDE